MTFFKATHYFCCLLLHFKRHVTPEALGLHTHYIEGGLEISLKHTQPAIPKSLCYRFERAQFKLVQKDTLIR